MTPVRIGVLGCAEIARRRMLPAMTACPATEVYAVASRDRDRAAATARTFGCRPVHGYDALLALDEVEAVYVPLPAALHAEWIEAALRAGKHVLGEKPLTTDPDRTRALLSLARERGLVLRENVMFVHHGQHAAVRDLVAGGAIGRLRSFHADFTVPERPDGDIRHRADLGGGALFDTGVYPVRAALHLLGGLPEVVGAVLGAGPGREVDTFGGALLRGAGGVSAHLTFGLENAYRSRYELRGSTGRITLDRAFTPPAGQAPVIRLEQSAGGVRELPLPAEDQVRNTVAWFAAAVRSGVPAAAAADTAGTEDADATATLRQALLLDRIRLCARGVEPADDQGAP
ncbi:Predicted dehydrogenase [Actinacidiphila yanglinensis]|uniref:Predicted dehydrogenase n=1 Tax=Actinacidiphila yanglinensis TaxID=310779 RepID=A0A1H6E0N8_9ACTN|nr:Gfo/Idh/MocA family oxidoreductase [Actinacidiphila yanglinensis]SEG90754.1 Predicted dehydrogenase [Actinacidiphila yanglinensis]